MFFAKKEVPMEAHYLSNQRDSNCKIHMGVELTIS
jgi:hypothetical protein